MDDRGKRRALLVALILALWNALRRLLDDRLLEDDVDDEGLVGGRARGLRAGGRLLTTALLARILAGGLTLSDGLILSNTALLARALAGGDTSRLDLRLENQVELIVLRARLRAAGLAGTGAGRLGLLLLDGDSHLIDLLHARRRAARLAG